MIGYPDSEQIPNVGASSAFTQKQKVLKPLRFQDFYWSEWRDLNSRPLDPQSQNICYGTVDTGVFLAIDMQ